MRNPWAAPTASMNAPTIWPRSLASKATVASATGKSAWVKVSSLWRWRSCRSAAPDSCWLKAVVVLPVNAHKTRILPHAERMRANFCFISITLRFYVGALVWREELLIVLLSILWGVVEPRFSVHEQTDPARRCDLRR